MTRGVLALGLVGTVVVATACIDPPKNRTPDEACDEATKAYCDKIQECAPFLMGIAYGGASECAARTNKTCPSGLKAEGTSATPDKLAQCAQDVRQATCDSLLGRSPPASCKNDPGRLTNGTPCGTDAQCQAGRCKPVEGKTCGVCTDLGRQGTECSHDDDCDFELGCKNGKCTPLGGSGAACGQSAFCAPSLGCVDGKCTTPLGEGAPCQPAATGLDPNPCNFGKGLFCHPTQRVCTLVGTAGPGGSCGVVGTNLVACTASECNAKDGMGGTCIARAADGASCVAGGSPACEPPAQCVDGRCTVGDPSACK